MPASEKKIVAHLFGRWWGGGGGGCVHTHRTPPLPMGLDTTLFGWKMKKLLIWSRAPYYIHCPYRFCYHRAKKYHSNHCPLPTLYLRQNLICPPASRLYLKELLSILQTVSSCSRYTIFLLFGSRFHRQNLPIPQSRTNFRLWANL